VSSEVDVVVSTGIVVAADLPGWIRVGSAGMDAVPCQAERFGETARTSFRHLACNLVRLGRVCVGNSGVFFEFGPGNPAVGMMKSPFSDSRTREEQDPDLAAVGIYGPFDLVAEG